MNHLLYHLNYVNAPVIKQKNENQIILESIFNKVWNPVFTIGVVTFILSMTLRGFFNQQFAVIPLGLSTLILFAGIWKLSAAALIVFDKRESNAYFIYKHLGYLQKIYVHSLTSFEKVELVTLANGKFELLLLKDDGMRVKVSTTKNLHLLKDTAITVASFLQIPFVD